tara:strand:- start:310 stop:669 length:360 start_codon:yes stop_codon:yes gene_type:complete
MKGVQLVRFFICLSVVSISLYAYLEKQNSVTSLAMQLPEKERELRKMQEEVTQLTYRIEQFESPSHLISLIKTNDYSHLKHPSRLEIGIVDEGVALEIPQSIHEPKALFKPRMVVGATP